MSKTKQSFGKVPVTEKALFQRIRRKLLNAHGELLRRARPHLAHEIGQFYVVDNQTGLIVGKDLDLEKYGRELGVLKPYETVVDGTN